MSSEGPKKPVDITDAYALAGLKCIHCKKIQSCKLINDSTKDNHEDEHWVGLECGHDWWLEGPDY